MVKVSVLRVLVLAGLMVSANALHAKDAVLTLEFKGDVTPYALACAVSDVAQNVISERDAVLTVAEICKYKCDCLSTMTEALKISASVEIKLHVENKRQYLANKYTSLVQALGEQYNSFWLIEGITQLRLQQSAIFEEIEEIFIVKMREALFEASNMDALEDLPGDILEYMVVFYDALQHTVSHSIKEAYLAALILHYPQYAEEIKKILN